MHNFYDEALDFESVEEWSSWLEQNQDKEIEAWVVIYKKRSNLPGPRYDEALEEALRFGWIDGKMKSVDADRFILRYSPRKAGAIWSQRNREKAERLIEQGRMTDAGLAKIEEAKKNGIWDSAYSSKRREDIPSDLEAALSSSTVAWKNFHGLANTYRNMFIRWVNGAGTEKSRKQRIEEVVKHAEINQKIRYGKI